MNEIRIDGYMGEQPDIDMYMAHLSVISYMLPACSVGHRRNEGTSCSNTRLHNGHEACCFHLSILSHAKPANLGLSCHYHTTDTFKYNYQLQYN